MAEETKRIEQRLNKAKEIYITLDAKIDSLPDGLFGEHKAMLKQKILGDKELKQLMDGIDKHRPPRLFLIGRTGVGKSSLINALCNGYVASVNDTRSCTEGVEIYPVKDGDRVLMEICDTRGIAESERIDPEQSAEDMLIEQINEFSPDVAMLVLGCVHRDDVNKDVLFLKKLAASYFERNSIRLPIVVVINRCDEAFPQEIKDPEKYTNKKENKIRDARTYYSQIIEKGKLKIDGIVSVSSLIHWGLEDGTILDTEEIENLTATEIEKLRIIKDYRYHIDELFDLLLTAIQDADAQMGLRMALRLDDVVRRLANHTVNIFSALAGTIALIPIPISDIYPLLGLQVLLVIFIAAFSGRDISYETAKEFLVSLVGTSGIGIGLKLVAQQLVKFANLWKPGTGSAVSSGIAALGTKGIGAAAISYYINKEEIEVAREKLKLFMRKETASET